MIEISDKIISAIEETDFLLAQTGRLVEFRELNRFFDGNSKVALFIKDKMKCKVCNKEFYREPSRIRAGTCSHRCGNILQKQKLKGIAIPLSRKLKISKTCKERGIGKWMLGRKNPILSQSNRDRKPQDHPNWKGGVTYKRTKGNYKGVKYVKCPKKYLKMARKSGYIAEHRLIMAIHLKHILQIIEVVHHIDHNPSNNNKNNLMLFPTNKAHKDYESLSIRKGQ